MSTHHRPLFLEHNKVRTPFGFLMIIQGLLVLITSISLYNYFYWIEKNEELIIIDSSLVEKETIDNFGNEQERV